MANNDEHILITGASGLVGRAAVEHFARAGYRTTAISRRAPFDDYGSRHLSVDLADRDACTAALSSLGDVTRIVFAALHEEPELVAGWTDPAHVRRNGDMLRNTVDAVAAASSRLSHVTILQGPKAYGVHVQAIRPDSREGRDDLRTIPNFYWEQQDYLAAKAKEAGFHWTVMRPSLVIGEAIGGSMNLIAALGVYGAILKARGEPLYYPGEHAGALEATDTDLMARAIDWAGSAPGAADRALNLTNGEVFVPKHFWPEIAAALGMEPGEDRPISMDAVMPGCADEWDAIRAQHDLRAPDMGAFIGSSWQFADFIFNGRPSDVPALISTVAIRQAGFGEAMYTDEMFAKWFERYRRDRLIP